MQPVTNDEPLLDAPAVARRFGVPVSWIYTKAESGELPSYKLGHYRRFDPVEIAEYLDARRQRKAAR